MSANKIIDFKAYDAVEIAASGTAYSQVLDLSRDQPDGHFSMQVVATGSGTVKLEYLLSNDGTTFVTPTGASDIVTAHTSGNDMYSISPMLARYIKFLATETGGANTITITCRAAIQ